ncbi:DUF4394 domain-containing protein [Hymenobacter qilianensis]|nr:DUF4394 domain-containing protein [Hymenobacter qilianensis]
MKTRVSLAKLGAAALLLGSLSSCEDILEHYLPKPTPPPPATPTFPPLGQDIPFYALSGGTRLDAYSTKDPATRTGSVAITGLPSGERILAMDFRPATGQLYGVSNADRLYVINQNTGVARALGTQAFNPSLAGDLFGFDFNPTQDLIRLVTNMGQRVFVDPVPGAIRFPGTIFGPDGATFTAVAYTNNVAGAKTTELYVIDSQNQQLYLLTPPNPSSSSALDESRLVPVGKLNLPISGDGGFDIDARTGTALGLFPVNKKPTLFTLNLSTGAARPLAQYNASLGYTSIAIPTRPVAYTFWGVARGGLLVIDLTNPSIDIRIGAAVGGAAVLRWIGLDFRPSNGQLYALARIVGGGNDLYTINPATGDTDYVSHVPVIVDSDDPGFDFDPITDRLRVVSSSGQNLSINPSDGTATVERPLTPPDLGIYTAAYSNNFTGTPTSTLYVMGRVSGSQGNFPTVGTLYQQMPPQEGTLVRVGDLGIPAVLTGSFDIGGTTNTGYAILNAAGNSALYKVDLATGQVTLASSSYNSVTPIGLAVGLGF